MKKSVTLIASRARDRLIKNNKEIIEEKDGGPAFYLSQVLKKERISFDLFNMPSAEVEILVKTDEEKGRIVKKIPHQKINFELIKTPIIVISTILDEINLKGIEKYQGKVFLDAQGFVRDGIHFGGKKKWAMTSQAKNAIFCLKATKEESQHLSKNFVKLQKQKILLITHGTKGIELFDHGERFALIPQRVEVKNAIGAGDTFFGYFIAEFLRNKSSYKAGLYATENTTGFLTHMKTIQSI